MFVSYSFHSPWFFIFFHAARLCFFSILYFFRCSAIFLSFYVTLFVFISFPSPFSFHARYFHVLQLPVHILSLSLHAMSKSSQIEYSECVTLVTMVVTIYMCEYWGKKTNIHSNKSIFFRVHIPFMPIILLSVSCQFPFTSFHVPSYFQQSYLCFTFILFNVPSFPSVPSCPSDVPLVSLSVRLIFLLMFLLIFLSCPFHFTLLSLQFPSLFPSSHSIFLVCPVIFQNHIEFPCIFVSNYVHGPWFFSWSSLLVYASGCQFIMW